MPLLVRQRSSQVPLYEELIGLGTLRFLVFSGDSDACVPFTGTQRWLAELDLDTQTPWRPWVTRESKLGGYVETYAGGVTFATVHAAGHQAPFYKPVASYDMLRRWLNNDPL